MAPASEAAPAGPAALPFGGALGWGRRGDGHHCAEGAHTYLADGRRLCWTPPRGVRGSRYAVDAERAAQPVPSALSRRLDAGDPVAAWGAWTRAEVCSKLLDVPVLVWLTGAGWPAAGVAVHGGRTVEVATVRCGDVVCSFGTERVRGRRGRAGRAAGDGAAPAPAG